MLSSPSGLAVGLPSRTRDGGWTLALRRGTTTLALTIDRAQHVDAVAAVEAGRHVHETIANLARTPALFVPSPLCGHGG